MSEMLAAKKRSNNKTASSGSSTSPPEPASSAKQTPDREILESANQVLILRNEKMKEQIVRSMIAAEDEEKVYLGDWKTTMKVKLKIVQGDQNDDMILYGVAMVILQYFNERSYE